MGSAHSQSDTVEKWVWSRLFRKRSLRKYSFFTPDHRSHVWKNNIYGNNRDLIKFQFETQIWILDMVRWWIWWWWECKKIQKKGKSETDVKTVRVLKDVSKKMTAIKKKNNPWHGSYAFSHTHTSLKFKYFNTFLMLSNRYDVKYTRRLSEKYLETLSI